MKVAMASTFGYLLHIQQYLKKLNTDEKNLIHGKNNDNLYNNLKISSNVSKTFLNSKLFCIVNFH